jgi:hypothetical protein
MFVYQRVLKNQQYRLPSRSGFPSGKTTNKKSSTQQIQGEKKQWNIHLQ